MSVVVAIKKDGKVFLGCDSQVTIGGTRATLKNPNNYKIWKVNGASNCLMGIVGVVRDACVIKTMDGLVTDYNIYKNEINYSFVVNKLVKAIIERLKEVNFLKKDGPFESMDSDFLFAYKDQLYYISGYGAVLEIDDYVAIGCGKNEAVGSLLSTEGLDPVERIIKSIKASAVNGLYVDYPIILTDTESMKFDVITEQNEKEFIEKRRG